LVDLASSLGFETKKFIAFGKEDNLACGLLGGQAKPNINKQEIEAIWNRSLELIEKFKNEI
jgi:hypothetical protein